MRLMGRLFTTSARRRWRACTPEATVRTAGKMFPNRGFCDTNAALPDPARSGHFSPTASGRRSRLVPMVQARKNLGAQRMAWQQELPPVLAVAGLAADYLSPPA